MTDLGSNRDDHEDDGDDDGEDGDGDGGDGDDDYGDGNGSPPGFSVPVDCSVLYFLSRFSQSQPEIEVFNLILQRNNEPSTG